MKRKFILIGAVLLMPVAVFAQGVWTTDTLPKFNMRYTQAEVVNGKIYGIYWQEDSTFFLDSNLVSRVSIFDPETHNWSFLAADNSSPRGNFATAMVGGKIYWIGAEPDTLINKVYVFDPITNSWSNIPYTGIFTSRTGFSTSVVDGKIYVIGGFGKGKEHATLEVFDPSTAAWSTRL